MKHIFSGTGVALVTPFKNDKSIDFNSLTKLVNHVLNGGVDYLVVMGTTGESATLSMQEKKAVLAHIADINNKKAKIVFGIGGNNTENVVKTIKETDFENIDGILSVAPYYNKPTQEGIYQHYKKISEAAPVPVIVYNVPGRTSVNITAETTLRLANECKNLTAVKEASGNFSQIMQIVKNKPEGFAVLSGDDAITMPLIAVGLDGVISVTANAFPKQFSDMVNFSLENKITDAKELHYKLLDITENLFTEGNPAGVKAALEISGIMQPYVRLPLAEASENLKLKLSKLIAEL